MPVPPSKNQPQKPTQAPPAKQQGQAKSPVPEKPPVTPEKPKPKKKTPSATKDDRFKFEMTYVNGGFNNGVLVRPDKDGKANVEISIYGGGEKKTLSVGPLPPNISKLVKAYELSANQDQNTPEITQELQDYFSKVQTLLNAKVIEIFKRADHEVYNAIKETFTQIKNDQNV